MIMDRIALILAIVGGLNWGSIGLFRFDIVAWLFGGQTATVSRVVYTLVGLAAFPLFSAATPSPTRAYDRRRITDPHRQLPPPADESAGGGAFFVLYHLSTVSASAAT